MLRPRPLAGGGGGVASLVFGSKTAPSRRPRPARGPGAASWGSWGYAVLCVGVVLVQLGVAARAVAALAAAASWGAAEPWTTTFPDLDPQCASIRRVVIIGERHTGACALECGREGAAAPACCSGTSAHVQRSTLPRPLLPRWPTQAATWQSGCFARTWSRGLKCTAASPRTSTRCSRLPTRPRRAAPSSSSPCATPGTGRVSCTACATAAG